MPQYWDSISIDPNGPWRQVDGRTCLVTVVAPDFEGVVGDRVACVQPEATDDSHGLMHFARLAEKVQCPDGRWLIALDAGAGDD